MRLRDWPGQRVVLDWPGHPDHGKAGQVVTARRQTAQYVQRGLVRWDDGDASYVPLGRLQAEARQDR